MRIGDFDHGAAPEVNAEVEATQGEKEHREHERDQRDDVEHERVLHERYHAAYAEEFHICSPSFPRKREPSVVYSMGGCAAHVAGFQTCPIEMRSSFFLPP